MSIIINALRQGHPDLALALIQHAKVYQLCEYDQQGQTALHLAVQKNFIDVMKALLEKGANINALGTDPSYTHMTPLHYAALTGNFKATQLLLAWGANIHLENGQYHTAATLAYQHGFLDIARMIERRYQHTTKYQWPMNSLQNQAASRTLEALQVRDLPKDNRLTANNVVDFVAYRKKRATK